jgi:predicted PurR-regulated permease PerM
MKKKVTPVQPVNSQIPKTKASEKSREMRPSPYGPFSISVLALAAIAVVGALYLGREVVLPIVLALVLKLMLQPIMNVLCDRLRVPHALSALLLIICLFGIVAAVALTISVPASAWIQKIPEILPDIQQKLEGLRRPIEYLQRAFSAVTNMASPGGDGAPTVAVKDGAGGVASTLALATVTSLSRFFATMVVLFFLLVAGDRLLRGFIEVLPRFSDKRQAATIANEIQRNIGGYLLTITLMNAAVGVATGIAMWGCGLGDPLLWGAIAFLLNYVPVFGPLTGIGMFLLAGIVTLSWPWFAFLPAVFYLIIHVVEGDTVTPLLLAGRFNLNPVLVIVSLFFWHALWGIPGALLAVPLLAVFKIVCDHLEPLKPMAHIIAA